MTVGTNKKRSAIVFLVAGQSNAGGCGVISPEAHEARGCHIERPLVPGSTAKEVGLSTNPDDYTHSYIWVPDHGFERIDPNRNAKPDKSDTPGHGMELPVLRELEKRFPKNDIFVIKYGPGATNLYEQWNPETQDCEYPCYATWLGYYRQALPQLVGAYPEVRVVGLYWDQGESDGIDNKADEYAENLAEFIATVRHDTGLLELPFFIRKHIFTWANIDTIIATQAEVVANDPLCHMLDIDLGNRQKNYDAWAYSPDNGHLSSKAFVELNRKLFDGPLREAAIDSFGVWSKEDGWQKTFASGDYAAIARAYADYMIKQGRDVYGKVDSPLFMTVLNRKTGKPFRAPYPHVIAKPYAPGLRRDHKMRPYDRTYEGCNPLEDLPLFGLLYRLTEVTGDKRYGEEANKSIEWFLTNTQTESGLFPWGSHMYYHAEEDRGVYAAHRYGGHEYNFVWPYWEQNPEALTRFAHGLWNEHIKNKRTGHFNRHSDDVEGGKEFPQTGACYLDIWAREYSRSGDPEIKKYIQTLLKFYRSMRDANTGAMSWCSDEEPGRCDLSNVHMNLFMASALQDAADYVEKRDGELGEEMHAFVRFIDDEYLSNDYDKILDVAGKGILAWYTVTERRAWPEGMTPAPEGVDTSVGFPLKTADGQPAASLYYLTPWFPGRSYAEFAIKLKNRHMRCEARHKSSYRRVLLNIADLYMTISPEVQFAQYPDNISDVVELLRYVYKLTGEAMYLHRADQMMQIGLRLFFDETSPLPKISNFDDWYESSIKNASSLEILRQMLELKLDLDSLPGDQQTTPRVVGEEKDGAWHATLTKSPDALLQYGEKREHGLYLSQVRSSAAWQVRLSDIITRIPTVGEADRLNGKMEKFTGKGHTAADIAYGGFKDVPVKVTLVIRNNGKNAAPVRVTADLHDTYHDNGHVQSKKSIVSGQMETFTIAAPVRKWIRQLHISPETGLQLEEMSVTVVKRSKLQM